MRHLFLAFAILPIMGSFLTTQAFLQDNLSDEDRQKVSQILNDISSIEAQEKEAEQEEFRDYLEEHRDSIRSLIRQINYLLYQYPRVIFIQKLKDSRDYLQDLVVNYELF